MPQRRLNHRTRSKVTSDISIVDHVARYILDRSWNTSMGMHLFCCRVQWGGKWCHFISQASLFMIKLFSSVSMYLWSLIPNAAVKNMIYLIEVHRFLNEWNFTKKSGSKITNRISSEHFKCRSCIPQYMRQLYCLETQCTDGVWFAITYQFPNLTDVPLNV